MKLDEIRARMVEVTEEAQGLQAAADAEGRALSPAEQAQVDGLIEEFDGLKAEADRREKLQAAADALKAPAPRKVPATQPQAAGRVEVVDREPRGKWGWDTFGSFAKAVKNASSAGGQVDNRLIYNAPSTYGQEGVGADGGFAVPPDFREAIWQKVMGEENLLVRCDQMTTSSNAITVPADETTPWDSSNGVQAYWEGEAHQITQSKPQLEQRNVRLHKLAALVPVTDELMEDAPALTAYLNRKVPEKINWKITEAIVRGTGAGQPLGFMNSPSLVTVAKEGSQAADTVLAENIIKMWARLYAPCRANAIWLINQDVEPQLDLMTIRILNAAGTEYVGGGPVYMPAGGLSQSPFSTLKGRPVIPTQAMETLGDLGDIALVDLRQYMAAVKAGGIRSDTSIHLFFDYAMTAFRFIFRMGGQPWWSGTISPRDGSNTLSAFVTLAERA